MNYLKKELIDDITKFKALVEPTLILHDYDEDSADDVKYFIEELDSFIEIINNFELNNLFNDSTVKIQVDYLLHYSLHKLFCCFEGVVPSTIIDVVEDIIDRCQVEII